MPLLGIIFFFLIGTIAGSFLNVLTFRFGVSSLWGRSRCLSCGKTLQWFELVPLLSFFFQRARCRSCHERISWQYPLVELITGVVFVLVVWKHGLFSFSSGLFSYSVIQLLVICYELFLWSLLFAIFIYDLRHKIIPDAFVYGFILLSFLHLLTSYFILHTSYFIDFLAGPLLALPLAAIWFISRGKALGLGDAKLALGIGWFLGLANGLSAFIIGFWLGALFSLAALALRFFMFTAMRNREFMRMPRKDTDILSRLKARLKNLTLKSELPLAPFLIAGMFIAYLTGVDVVGLSLLLL